MLSPKLGGNVDKDQVRQERVRLQGLLANCESGKVTHYEEDESGELKRDTTAEQCASLKGKIAELDRKLSED